jgi:uncharacterized repeat protein (TIGR03803 family)
MSSIRFSIALLEMTLILTIAIMASAASAASREKILYTFTGGADGGDTSSGVISDKAGNLYGMTYSGGANGQGTVFEMMLSNGRWTEVVLHGFNNDGVDGYSPEGGLIMDKAGNLYGTTMFGGSQIYGTVFELSPTSNGWTESVLYNFTGGTDGGVPGVGSLAFDGEGRLYGTTLGGGAYGYGVVFELSPSSGGWTETVLHSFAETTSDGGSPTSVVLDSKGDLYGATAQSGTYGRGTVFKLSRSIKGSWKETVLHDFAEDNQDGGHPVSGVTVRGGDLFGATENGGPNAWGTIYELTRVGNHWKEILLDRFSANGVDGFAPECVVIFDSAGNLYGTTYSGGKYGYGTVFELIRSTTGWKQKLLHSFNGTTDGGFLPFGVIKDGKGNLYGTTQCGGSARDCSGYGVVFEILQ